MLSVAQRALIAAAGVATLGMASPVATQADRGAVLNILVECAKIDDPTARLACFDNNIRNAGGTARATVPGQVRGVTGGAAPVETQGPQGFGYEDVRRASPERFALPAGQLDEIHPRVASVAMQQPGIYRVGLEDGAEWVFAESVPLQYRLPRRGQEIEIERGFGGSFLMRVDGQPPVPVRRVR
jgi:hypothetical protein